MPLLLSAPMRHLRGSGKSAQVALYRAAFQRDAAFIGGRLHVPSFGPGWVVTAHATPHVRLVEEFGHHSGSRFHPADWVFRHDRLAEAEAMLAASIAAGRIGRRGPGAPVGRVTAAGSSARIDVVSGAAEAARTMLSLAAAGLAAMPAAAIHAYADVSGLLAAGVDGDSARFLLTAVADLHAAWSGTRAQPGPDPVGRMLARLGADHVPLDPEGAGRYKP